jgi:NTP pyrophosphatase (non-canonical NTP hydrolase)
MNNEEIIKYLVENNDYKYNLLKTSEELQELALVLTQMALKKEHVDKQEVIDELGDVEIRLKIISNFFNREEVEKRINFKLNKFKKYIKQGKYKGGI